VEIDTKKCPYCGEFAQSKPFSLEDIVVCPGDGSKPHRHVTILIRKNPLGD